METPTLEVNNSQQPVSLQGNTDETTADTQKVTPDNITEETEDSVEDSIVRSQNNEETQEQLVFEQSDGEEQNQEEQDEELTLEQSGSVMNEPSIDNYYNAPQTHSFAKNLDIAEQRTALALYNEENGTNLEYQDRSERAQRTLGMAKTALKSYGWFAGVTGETEQEYLTNALVALFNIKDTLPATLKDITLGAATGLAKTADDISDLILPESMEFPDPDYNAKTPLGKMADPLVQYATISGAVKKVGLGALKMIKPLVKSRESWNFVKTTTLLLGELMANGAAMWREQSNISNVLKDSKIPWVSWIGSFLAIDEDDEAAERFWKSGIEGTLVGIPANVLEFTKSSWQALRASFKNDKAVKEVTTLNTVLRNPVPQEVLDVRKAAKAFSDYAAQWDIKIPREVNKAKLSEVYEGAAKKVDGSGYYNVESAEERLDFAKKLVKKEKDIVKKAAVAGNILDAEWNAAKEKFFEAQRLYNNKSIDKQQLDDVFWDTMDRLEKFDGVMKDATAPAGQALKIASESEANLVMNQTKRAFAEDEQRLLMSAIMNSETGEALRIKWGVAKKLLGANTAGQAYKKLMFLTQSNLMFSFNTHFKNIESNFQEMGKKIIVDPAAVGVGWVRRSMHLGDYTDYVTMEDTGRYAKRAISEAVTGTGLMLKNAAKGIKEGKLQGPTDEMKHIYHNLMGIKQDTPEELFISAPLRAYAKYGPLKAASVEDMVFATAQFKASLEEYLSRQMRKTGLSKMDQKQAGEFMYNKILSPDSGEELSGLLRPIQEKYIAKNAIKYASEKAKYQTFKGGYSKATDVVSKLMNLPVIKLIYTPFVQTRASMLFDHVIRDDLGSMVGYGSFWGRNGKWGAEADKALGKGLELWGTGLAILWGSTSLSLDGKLTGGKFNNKEKEQNFIQAGGQHNSLVFTDEDGRRSYLSIPEGTIGDILKMGASLAQAYDDFSDREDVGKVFEDPEVIDAVMEMARVVGAYVLDELQIKSLGEVFTTAGNIEENSESAKQKLVNLFANATVPRALQGIGSDKRFKKDYARDFYEMISNKIGIIEKARGGQPRIALSNTGKPIVNDDSWLFAITGMHYKKETEIEKLMREGNIIFPRKNSVPIGNGESAPISKEENFRLRQIMNANGSDKRIDNMILANKNFIKTKQAKDAIMGFYNQEVSIAVAQLLKENPDIIRRTISNDIEEMRKQFEL